MPQATTREASAPPDDQELWGDDIVTALIAVVLRLKRASTEPGAGSHAFLLAHIDRLGPVRATEIAEQAGLDLSTVSRHMRSLEEAGLVRRTPDPDDRRAALLSVSDAGRDLLDRVSRTRIDLLTRATAGWSRDDVAALPRLLHRLAHDLENL